MYPYLYLLTLPSVLIWIEDSPFAGLTPCSSSSISPFQLLEPRFVVAFLLFSSPVSFVLLSYLLVSMSTH